ncbi:hypothetical protein PR048_001841 [Dryococelus australis]|uniref:Uncharacterized protein n=1 Tax=Dryococelus australis TaxID=614101 RepID=A0ABQ9IJ66_9NEOP|nr:hypothetical protein PR048_001841 [Dryococelus australis]
MPAMDNDDILVVAAVVLILKKTRKWCEEWALKRTSLSHTYLLNELRMYPLDWHNYLRMDEETYCRLSSLVASLIEKEDTAMRKSITAHKRLLVTLRFLVTGISYADMKFTAIISRQVLSKIIPETCVAIYTELKKEGFLNV